MSEEKDKLSDYITRDMYRQMKSMNRERFCNFLYTLYKEIYSDYENSLQPDYDKVYREVQKIHGIGEVKAKQIVEVVRECMNNKDI